MHLCVVRRGVIRGGVIRGGVVRSGSLSATCMTPAEIFGIDLTGHHDHLARCFFFRLRIAGKISLHVAMSAFDGEGRLIKVHLGHQIGGLQELEVLGRRPRGPSPSRSWRLLSEQRSKTQ